MSAFDFPSIYNFPPFFTQQPNEATWQTQAQLWISIILSYCRFYKIHRLDLSDALTTELFYNKSINRRLKLETLQSIIKMMIKQGLAEWDPPNKKTSAFIYWKKPEEWATSISNWVSENGLNNSIVTLYEIAHGEASEGTEFHEIDQAVLLKALDVLVKKGEAQTLQATNAEEMGVKFFGTG
ncbi:5245_t:CDS:2 [Paraglomus brasilianum]|uniref:Vacuolar protein-sorting-associated protein 25 n=1 Tax=Paraglomus brasilianum TaxID=144538 RepID=A0A9N9BWF7_9GLOM|nr:5245_t:CDS:2 [Paraglomus brasilianum]